MFVFDVFTYNTHVSTVYCSGSTPKRQRNGFIGKVFKCIEPYIDLSIVKRK